MASILEILGATGIVSIFLGAMLVPMIIGYVYLALVLMGIRKKANVGQTWMAWVPIANLYLMTQIAGVPWWTMLLVIFLPMIPAIGPLASGVVLVFWWWKICEKLGKPGWWSLLMLIPIVNLVIMGILAWGKK